MKKNIPTPLADEYIQSLQQIHDAEPNLFFYTRLKARMEKKIADPHFSLQPAWLISLLITFLFINIYFLATQITQNSTTSSQNAMLQNFASSYDLSVPTSF